MIRPIRVKTLEELKAEYPNFNKDYICKEIGYTPDKFELLGKPITDWNPDTICTSTWIKAYDKWIRRQMILFEDDGEKPKSLPSIDIEEITKMSLFEKRLEPKKSTVIFHDRFKITITIEEI